MQTPHKARADWKMRKRLEPLRLVMRPFIQVLNGVGEYPNAAVVREAFGERGDLGITERPPWQEGMSAHAGSKRLGRYLRSDGSRG